ncbi:3-oxoacyl-ACP synthase [Aequorivita sp. H23M31]|uniref:3-oxoacyl-ACP synthase n=1 Tax=Aequorivita ciconiae TaxID=2494375 RepID=A0A410G4W0_9FLAO|nr:3-oxoacyl-ACP synthase [Aequorivita sp. H23M31]QAA82255.1 3-oxoacyl-ACP synthase [Aequorivita sp. H23M31]
MNVIELKTELLNHCQRQVDTRYSKIKQTISDIEESLLEESKSSSGDKHETGRAMLQIDRENAGKQLMEIEKIIQILKRIDVQASADYVRLGSLVYTEKFNYFISLSIGNVNIDGLDYLCVALNSPIGLLLSGKRKDDGFVFNGHNYTIKEVK